MENLRYIFAKPITVDGINIYPIKVKDYEEFQNVSKLLYISKNHYEETDIPLLILILLTCDSLGYNYEDLINDFTKLFSLVTQQEVEYIEEYKVFKVGETGLIQPSNYDDVRQCIMKQNLIFEQKVYKDKLVQEWANKVLASKQRNSAKITFEDFITTVKVYNGLESYDIIENYSIYQVYADFYRIGKIEQFRQSSLFATVSTEPISIQHFAENIDIFKSPYDDLFVSSSKLDKFGMLNK